MKLETLVPNLQSKLDSALISSRVLLDRKRLIDESSRKTAAYQDPRYVPFYYYLGKELRSCPPVRLVEIGVRLGLLSSCFFQGVTSPGESCPVEEYLGFQQREEGYYSPRLAKANLKDHFKGDIFLYVGDFISTDWSKKLYERENNLVFVTMTMTSPLQRLGICNRYQLDKLWESLALDGMIVADGVAKNNLTARSSFEAFCKINNKEPIYFETRYGTGIVQK